MRTLGIDFGTKRIGVAVSDPLGIVAQGILVINSKSIADDINEIKKVISSYNGISEVVVGLPKNLKGEIGLSAQGVLKFVEALKKEISLNIITWDERMTTAAAEKSLISTGMSRSKRKQSIDKSAAAMILQSYLDRKKF